jgi:hypothetical protein
LFFSRSSSSILHCVQHFLFFFLCVLAWRRISRS